MIKRAILIVLFLLSFLVPLFADEIPVNIKANKLRYVEGSSIVEASGSVEVRLKEVTIHADLLQMDSETNVVTAEGNVRIITRDYDACSRKITYNTDTEISNFSDFNSQVTTDRVKGTLFISAKDLKEKEGKMDGKNGAITTCDDRTHHYVTAAERLEYFPDDKIIGYNVTLYIGKMPAFWMPYMVYDLNQKRKRNWEIGHNDVEGDFFKSTWDYPYGLLYLDLMEKKGFGHGTELKYGLGAWGAGTFFLYHLDEADTRITDWITRIHHTKQINPSTELTLDHSYTATYLIPSGRRDQTNFGLNLAHSGASRWNIKQDILEDRVGDINKYSGRFDQNYQRLHTDYNYNYEHSTKDPKWIRSSQRLNFRRPLWSDKVMFKLRGDYHNNVVSGGESGDERLEPEITITGREDDFSWRYSENWYIDLDKDLITADNTYQYLEKQPEISVSPNPIDLNLFTLKPTFGYGHYREVRYVSQLGGNRDFATERYQTSVDASRSIPLNFGTTANLGAGVDQYIYTTNDQLYAYRESLGLKTDLNGFFRNDINYKKGMSDGNSPFFFDRLGTDYHNITEQLSLYHLSKVNWTTSGGYNWQTEKWFEVMTSLSLKPTDKLSWNLRTGWDIENQQYKDLVNSLRLYPKSYLSLEFSTTSDINLGSLKSGSVLYELILLEEQANQLKLKVGQVYEVATQQFKVRDIMVTKDLHCWQMIFTYSDYRKEMSFAFSLKAMPDEPFGFSSGRGFYMDAFQKEFNEIQGGGDVRRY
jgi:hypothetical protein